MGKLFSRQRRSDSPRPPQQPEKKVYSWEREDRPDPKDYKFADLQDVIVGKVPGKISGQQFLLQNCKNCVIYLFDHSAAVTVDDCIDCQIFIGPVKGSVFFRDCSGCRVMVISQQLRCRDCSKMQLFMYCPSQPVIESCTGMKFGCISAHYSQLQDQCTSAGLSLLVNNWSNIHDFTPASGETNWRLTTEIEFDLPDDSYPDLKGVGLSTAVETSVIPYTVGTAHRPVGQMCLVMFVDKDQMSNVDQALKVTRQCLKKGVTVVQIQEQVLPKQVASQLFPSNEKVVQSITGIKVIGIEMVNDDCSTVIMEAVEEACPSALNSGSIFVSCDPQQAIKDVDTFFNVVQSGMPL